MMAICHSRGVNMRNLRKFRKNKGISIKTLSKETGISTSTIWKHEVGRTEMNKLLLKKIAKFFKTTSEELNKEIIKENLATRPCLNEVCPLNKNKECVNDVVLSGRAPCFGKDKVQQKYKINYQSTKALFIN